MAMNERTKLGLGVLEVALLLGLLGDALLRATPWGLNLPLWVGVLTAAFVALNRQKHRTHASEGRWLLPCVLLFAAAFAWRDSQTLRLVDALVILVLLALVALRTRKGHIRLAGLTDYALSFIVTAANTVFGMFPLVFMDVRWREIPRAGWSRHALAIMRGLAIAIPLLLVFGALLMAADAIFERLVSNTFSLDVDLLFTHLVLIIFFTWVTAGFFRGMLLGKDTSVTSDRDAILKALGLDAGINGVRTDNVGGGQFRAETTGNADEGARATGGEQQAGVLRESCAPKPGEATSAPSAAPSAHRRISLGIVEIGVVLGLLDLLFFSFVVVQLRYLFGGANLVLTSAGLTYADYARRGFFELVWVAALVLPLLLVAHWLLRKEIRRHEHIFRVLSGVMVALLFVIMLSALQRMRLYQSEYGLTELRLYTTAFMGWLGMVFLWFAFTVLWRSRREQFAMGALVAALSVAAALHFVNPNALIVRTNLSHARAQHRFDASYAVSLGADAFPALAAALDGMTTDEGRLVAGEMLEWLKADRETDWRSWNWSRAAARQVVLDRRYAVLRREAELREWTQRPPAATPDYQRSQTALAPIPGTTLSLAIERLNSHPFRPEYRRYAVLMGDNQPLARIELAYDAGGQSSASLFQVSDSLLILQDAFDAYEVNLKRRTISRREARMTDLTGVKFIGVFNLDESKTWRFLPVGE